MHSIDLRSWMHNARTLLTGVFFIACLCSCRQGYSLDEGVSGRTFLEAVKVGNNKKAALLLLEGVHTEVRDERGDTPLLYAVRMGNLKLVRLLLKHGVAKDARSGNGRGVLELAVDSGNKEMMVCLLEGGVSPDELGHDNNPLFLKAVRFGDMDTVQLLIKHGVSANTAGKDGKTALHIAARDGLKQYMELLLAAGVNPDAKDDEGLTPLWAAASASGPVERWQGISRLLEAGADGDSPGKDKETLLTLAIRGGLYDEAVELINHGAEVEGVHDGVTTPMEAALEVGRKDMIELLLSRGLDGKELLGEAFHRGDVELARLLFASGVCFDEDLGDAGLPPEGVIAGCVRRGQVELADLCLRHGADPHRLGKEGLSPLHMAISRGDVPMSKLLLHYGGLLERERDQHGDGLVARCVRQGQVELVELLIRYGVDPKIPGKEGQKPLHMAIALRNAPIVRALLQHGADSNAYFKRPVSQSFLELTEKDSMKWFLKNERRVTPLMMAANNGDLAIIASLLEHGARKYTATARHRLYPLNFASRRGDVKAMQLILGQDPDEETCFAVLDLSDQKVRLYNMQDELIFTSKVSTGRKGYDTPEGSYVITDKHVSHVSNIYHVKMPYFQRLSCGAFGFHSGGIDLVFPHHENEIAQSRCACGGNFAAHWFHITHLMVDGGKMSKSLGNLYTIDDLAEKGHSAMEVRYVLLSGHYRKQLNFTLDSLHAAREALQKLAKGRAALESAAGDAPNSTLNPPQADQNSVFAAALEALNNDLNTPAALGHLFSGLKAAQKLTGDEAAANLVAFDALLNALGLELPAEASSADIPAEISELAERRWQAKQNKDWATSDQLRDELTALGWTIKDNPDGYELVAN